MQVLRFRTLERSHFWVAITVLAIANAMSFSLLVRDEMAAAEARLAVARANNEIAAMRTRSEAAFASQQATLDQIHQEVARLNARLDDRDERDHYALAAANKRIDWLETLVYSEVTGSAPATPAAASNPPLTPGRHGPQPHASSSSADLSDPLVPHAENDLR